MSLSTSLSLSLLEAIAKEQLSKANVLITTYLKKKLKKDFFHFQEKFIRNGQPGTGVRFVTKNIQDGSFRINFIGNTAHTITDVEFFSKKNEVSDFTISFTDESIVQILRSIVFAYENRAKLKSASGAMIVERFMFNTAEKSLLEAMQKTPESVLKQDIVEIVNTIQNGDADSGVNALYFAKRSKKKHAEKLASVIFARHSKMFDQVKPGFFAPNDTYDGNDILDDVDGIIEDSDLIIIDVEGGAISKFDLPVEEEKIPFEEQIDDLVVMTKLLLKGSSNLLLVTGSGGVGKTYNIMNEVKKAGYEEFDAEKAFDRMANGDFESEDVFLVSKKKEYVIVKGSGSPSAVYKAASLARKSLLIIDDADAILGSTEGQNLLKALTDTTPVRKVSWAKAGGGGIISGPKLKDLRTEWAETLSDIKDGAGRDKTSTPFKKMVELFGRGLAPKAFDFEGRVIIISNLPTEKASPDGSLLTRALTVTIEPTSDEVYNFILKRIAPNAMATTDKGTTDLGMEVKTQILDLLSKNRKMPLSIRRFVRAVDIYGGMIESGASKSTAEDMVSYYA